MNIADLNAAKVLRDFTAQILKNVPAGLPLTNTPLPINFDVIQKLPNGSYLIDVGGKHLEAASSKELTDKARYWAQVSQKDGVTTLINAIKKPDVLQFGKEHTALEPISIDTLTKLLTQKNLPDSALSSANIPQVKVQIEPQKEQTTTSQKPSESVPQTPKEANSSAQIKSFNSLKMEFLTRAVTMAEEPKVTQNTVAKPDIKNVQENQIQNEPIKTQTMPSRLNTPEALLKQTQTTIPNSDMPKQTMPNRLNTSEALLKQTQTTTQNEVSPKSTTPSPINAKPTMAQQNVAQTINNTQTKPPPDMPSRLKVADEMLKQNKTIDISSEQVHSVKNQIDTKPQVGKQNTQEAIKQTVITAEQNLKASVEASLAENHTITPQEEAALTEHPAQTYEELKQAVKALGQMPLIFSQADFVSQDTLNTAFAIIFGATIMEDEIDTQITKEKLAKSITKEEGAETGTQKPSESKSSDVKEKSEPSKDTPLNRIKNMVLEEIANASTKQDFMILSNVALALNRQVVSMIVEDEEKKRALMQFRKKNEKEQQRQSVEFYSAFELLGPVAGEITLASGEIFMTLECEFENTKNFLQQKLGELRGFDMSKVSIKQSKVNELFVLSASLLDIAG